MFIVFLTFSDNKAAAPQFMDGHNAWIAEGFDAGVFLCTGSLRPAAGGVVIAHGESREALEARLDADPFVVHDVVKTEIREIAPGRTVPALDFLTA
ncbi:YciI family protein [Amorphus coralli]|uniref:YciI family protein n=1 Tax=Amorphus coralli TaxID=340680 RepID=UPI000377F1E0|nr:YciI family protein [Amorphus coralli]